MKEERASAGGEATAEARGARGLVESIAARSFSLALACNLLASIAQLLLKRGMSQGGSPSFWSSILTLPVVLGYGFYAASTVLFILALRRGELERAHQPGARARPGRHRSGRRAGRPGKP